MRLIVARCEVSYTGRLTAFLPESTRLIVLKADGSVLVHADAGGYEEEEAFHQDGEDGDRERRPGGNRSAEKRHHEADFDGADEPGAEEEEDGESERERALPYRAEDVPVEIAEESLAQTAAGEDASDAAEPASDPAGRALPPAGEPLEQGDEHGQEGQQRQAEKAQARGKRTAPGEDRAEPNEENLRQELGHGRLVPGAPEATRVNGG